MIDIRQSPEYADYLSRIGWTVEGIDGTNYFIKKLPLIGSILKLQRPEILRYKDTRILSEKHRIFQTIVEPISIADCLRLTDYGFKQSKSQYLPTKTLWLDLTVPKQKLFKNLKKDAKSALRITNNLKLITYNLKDLKNFRNAWKKAVGLKRYVPPLAHLLALNKAFGKKSLFILDEDKNAGAIFLIGGESAHYWQAFANKEGRKLLLMYKIVWEGILWAKRMGCKVFDFEGIYDERFPNKSWLGFTHFKKSFGGREVSYPGCYIKNMFPFLSY